MHAGKETLKIVVVGHVDHGKSTVIGRLLYNTNSIAEGRIQRVRDICKEKGKPFEYAYLLDAFEEEQKQGITIDTTQLQFFTEKRDYVIIDAPGHREFLKNMISGAANAEAALLIIDGKEGVQEQSRRHGYILSLLGIKKVYVVVNKMDLIGYSESLFRQIRQEMNVFLNGLNVYPLEYIPVSAFYGENIDTPSDKMPWYTGAPILEAMDQLEKDRVLESCPLRFPIQDVYKFDDRRIIVGRIESGSLAVGDTIELLPDRKTTRIKTIESWQGKSVKTIAEAGESIGITVEDEFFNRRGEVIAHPGYSPLVTELFRANLFWMGKNPLVKGKKYKLKLVTQEVEFEVAVINRVIDATTLETLENADAAHINDVAEITLKSREPLCLDPFHEISSTGRFVLMDGYDVCGGGIITGLPEAPQTDCILTAAGYEVAVKCFDEYYYSASENNLRLVPARAHRFSVGDRLPILGKTYSYPNDFDIIDTAGRTAARIRKASLSEVIRLEDYRYDGKPLTDIRGFLIQAVSEEKVAEYLNSIPRAEDIGVRILWTDTWHAFSGFRTLRYYNSREQDVQEYTI